MRFYYLYVVFILFSLIVQPVLAGEANIELKKVSLPVLKRIQDWNGRNPSSITKFNSIDGMRKIRIARMEQEKLLVLESEKISVQNPRIPFNPRGKALLLRIDEDSVAFFPRTGIAAIFGKKTDLQLKYLCGTAEEQAEIISLVATEVIVTELNGITVFRVKTDPKKMMEQNISSLLDPLTDHARNFITRYTFSVNKEGQIVTVLEEYAGREIAFEVNQAPSQNSKEDALLAIKSLLGRIKSQLQGLSYQEAKMQDEAIFMMTSIFPMNF